MPRILRTIKGLAAIGLAGGLTGAAALIPAQAASATDTVSVTVAAKSDFAAVTGDTYVAYKGAKGTGTATLSGQVSGASSGERLALYAKPFRAKSYKATGKPKTLTGVSPESYSFKVKPTIATSYQVRVLSGSTAEATASGRVYVTEDLLVNFKGGKIKCHGSTCKLTLKAAVAMPASAYRTESRKHWYLYVGRLTKTGLPNVFILSTKSKASKPHKLNRSEYAITWTFIGPSQHHKLGYLPDACTRDTESRDGMGLPGHHHCGDHRVPASEAAYLG
jgi:hypothetical protein